MKIIGIAVSVAFIAVVCIGIYSEYQDCKRVNGIFVRGLFSMECIVK